MLLKRLAALLHVRRAVPALTRGAANFPARICVFRQHGCNRGVWHAWRAALGIPGAACIAPCQDHGIQRCLKAARAGAAWQQEPCSAVQHTASGT